LASITIPNQRGFSLVGDSNRCDFLALDFSCLESSFNNMTGIIPDFQGIMFYPTWLGIDLLMFQLVYPNWFSAAGKNHTTGAGSTLVNSSYIPGHGYSSTKLICLISN
jgi:hypothetical protein